MEQADEALRSAEVNLSMSMVRSAVNRAYYAMFYAVLALLATRRAETSRHSGAISLFDREFVKPSTLPKDFSRWLHDAFSERQEADYGTDFGRTAEDAAESVRRAREFVAGVRDLLKREGTPPTE
jgi:uncharacterized protein (UPF0332 family)